MLQLDRMKKFQDSATQKGDYNNVLRARTHTHTQILKKCFQMLNIWGDRYVNPDWTAQSIHIAKQHMVYHKYNFHVSLKIFNKKFHSWSFVFTHCFMSFHHFRFVTSIYYFNSLLWATNINLVICCKCFLINLLFLRPKLRLYKLT